MKVAIWPRKFVKYCKGNRTRTARTLKKSWTIAADNASLNSILRLICVRETKIFVTDVPMLAPMMMGMALATFRAPPATSPTTMDVVNDEDWTMEVERIPTNSPIKGFVVVVIRASARPWPSILSDAPISSILNRKRYKKHSRKRKLNNVM
jgi:hypothetical protein